VGTILYDPPIGDLCTIENVGLTAPDGLTTTVDPEDLDVLRERFARGGGLAAGLSQALAGPQHDPCRPGRWSRRVGDHLAIQTHGAGVEVPLVPLVTQAGGLQSVQHGVHAGAR
jgi:hypothetical protein